MIDAHAFLYFGDGQSVKFHSGRYKPDGGALMIGKEGIEGWWSAPNLKTDVTERASGNGGHDVAADRILYATRTVTVHFDAIGDVHSEVLDAVTKVSQANGMPVRFRVVDDQSDTFVSGYVHPQFGATWNERHQTGTLTIVCPRPERLAWSPLQTQLFPVSVMQGGLRYSTVHRLVSAWTGTPNASASNLSQDGKVVATNWVTDPNALQKVGTWSPAGSTTVAQLPDEHWMYAPGKGVTEMTLFIPITPLAQDDYVYCEWLGGTGDGHLENMDTVAKGNGWVLGKNTNPAGNKTIQPTLNGTPITILKVGRYSAADYETMKALGVDWFSGDSYPVPTGKGLSYPLNYGTAGSASNVALLLNQGSSKAYPVLTVTGSFPNGVQIQWDGNALQYDGAIGAVPLILDSRSRTASMGGVDVSRNLSRRDFPVVPAGGSVSLRLMSAGTGWVTAVCRDTYI